MIFVTRSINRPIRVISSESLIFPRLEIFRTMKEEEREGFIFTRNEELWGKKVKFLFFFNDNRIFDGEEREKFIFVSSIF